MRIIPEIIKPVQGRGVRINPIQIRQQLPGYLQIGHYLSDSDQTAARRQSMFRHYLPQSLGKLFFATGNRVQAVKNIINTYTDLMRMTYDMHQMQEQIQSKQNPALETVTKVSFAEFALSPAKGGQAFDTNESKEIMGSIIEAFKKIVQNFDKNFLFNVTIPYVELTNSQRHAYNANNVIGFSAGMSPYANRNSLHNEEPMIITHGKVYDHRIDPYYTHEGEQLPRATPSYNAIAFPMVTNNSNMMVIVEDICFDHFMKVSIRAYQEFLEQLYLNSPEDFVFYLKNPITVHEIISASIEVDKNKSLTNWVIHTDATIPDNSSPIRCAIKQGDDYLNVRNQNTENIHGHSVIITENNPLEPSALTPIAMEVLEKVLAKIKKGELVPHNPEHRRSKYDVGEIDGESANDSFKP